MKSWWIVSLFVVGVGCGSTPNPESCLDGSCTDPRFPYCDVEGFIDEPGTCIEVTCTAGELRGCRGDRAITCNTTGNNFDLVECPLGCDENGCRAQPPPPDCVNDSECTNPTPICGATMTCRRCELDDECASGVCDLDTGSCAGISEVLYVSATGSDSAQCVSADPCSLPRAITLATTNPLRPWVKLAAGTYEKSVQTSTGTARLVGPRAAILKGDDGPTSGVINVGAGGKIGIRGIEIDLTRKAVFCGGVGTSGAFVDGGELHLHNVLVTSPSSNRIHFSNGCVGSIRDSKLEAPIGGGILMNMTAGHPAPRATFDRFHLQSSMGSITHVSALSATVTNSVFEYSTVSIDASSKFAFNTIYGTQLFADGGRVENSIILAPGNTDAFFCTGCTSRSNIAFPQMMTITGTTVMDPQLVDAPNRDLQLKATSPALNMAMPQPDLTTDHDFNGVMRPQGAAHDIGAFERSP